MPKNDAEEFAGNSLHVTQMEDFELLPPQADERPQTVWDMTAAADESGKPKKTKQSASVAATAEQEK